MDVTPHSVRTTRFKTARKGYDTDEVDRFKEATAAAIEQAQNQATAMEARARAAVARLQEITHGGGDERQAAGSSSPAAPPAAAAGATASDHETISKTLLIAQRTADTLVAEAKGEANHLLESAKAQSAQMVEDARAEARKAFDTERDSAQNEVQALLAKRDFLLGDAEHLDRHVADQRNRLREVAANLTDIAERPAGGLGEVRLPLLSAAADSDAEPPADLASESAPDASAGVPVAAATDPAEG
jgi:DivIVA domain-containing protein